MVFDGMGRKTSVRFDLACSPEPVMVVADRGQIRQVISNLIANSVQAMDGNGEVNVELSEDQEYDVLLIRDNGPGVDAAHRAQLFEPLFTTKAKGTGLGLTICRQLIERHGGTLDLQDHAGSGALFCIRLPRSTS